MSQQTQDMLQAPVLTNAQLQDQEIRLWFSQDLASRADLEVTRIMRAGQESQTEYLQAIEKYVESSVVAKYLLAMDSERRSQDMQQSIRLLKDASAAGFLPAYYALAQLATLGLLPDEEGERAIDWALKGADLGSSLCLLMLAALYRSEENYDAKILCGILLNAARKGLSWEAAALLVEVCVENESRLEREDFEGFGQEAVELITLAEAQNFLPAKVTLARMFFTGSLLAQDKERAIALWRAAYEAGEIAAGRELVGALLENNDAESTQEAIAIAEAGVQAQDSESCVLLGMMYEEGLGVAIDRHKAKEYYLQAARYGASKGFTRAALVLLKGSKEEVNEALLLLEEGRKHWDGMAAFLLGYLLLTGCYGVETDQKRGLQYIQNVAGFNFGPAIGWLAQVYTEGLFGVEQSSTKARRWLQRGLELKEPRTCTLQALLELNSMDAENQGEDAQAQIQTVLDYLMIGMQGNISTAYALYAYLSLSEEGLSEEVRTCFQNAFACAALNDDGPAYYYLGNIFVSAINTPVLQELASVIAQDLGLESPDPKQTYLALVVYCLERARALGDVRAQAMLDMSQTFVNGLA